MEDEKPPDRNGLSVPVRIVLILIVIFLGLYAANHPNSPLSVLIKMLLVP